MTNTPQPSDYDDDLFAGRNINARFASINQLVDYLLRSNVNKRSIILEASPCAGKSWLLEHLNNGRLKQHQLQPIVVLVTSRLFGNFQPPQKLAQLFVPFVEQLYDQVRHYYAARGLNIATLPARTNQVDEIKNNLASLAGVLSQNNPPPLLVLLFDGMEEVVELSQATNASDLMGQNNILWQFENTCIVPLFKHQNVRLLATCRANADAQWRSFSIKPRTEQLKLDPFAQAAEQWDKRLIKLGQPGGWQFDHIRDQIPGYSWGNTGANAWLMEHAIQNNGTINRQAVGTCVDSVLLTSPANKLPLDDQRKNQLRQVIRAFGRKLIDGVNVVDVGTELALNDNDRNKFVNELSAWGLCVVKSFAFTLPQELVELVLAEQLMP